MPLILAFTDTDGTPYTASYWRIGNYSANERTKTGSFQMHGWRDLGNYSEGKDNLRASPQEFLITDPTVYDARFGEASKVSTYPFLEWLESYAAESAFFLSADQFSYIEIVSADIGSFDASRLYVRFNDTVTHTGGGGNFTDGVTIRVNGSPVSISTAAQDTPDSVIRYDLASPIDANDVVTWEYDVYAPGWLISAGFTALTTFLPFSVTNLVGSYLHFNNSENSIHLATAA